MRGEIRRLLPSSSNVVFLGFLASQTNTRCVQDTHSVTFQLRKFDIISTFSFPLRMEPYSTFPKTQRSSQNF